MPDRCEVLPGDSVVARRGGGLLWVDAPGSPSLARGAASFAIVLSDTSGGTGTGVALWSGKGQPAVDGVPVSGSSVEGCTLAAGFQLGQTLYVGPGQAAPSMPPGVAFDLVEGTVPGSGALLQLAAAAHSSAAPPATSAPAASSYTAGSDAGFGSGASVSRGAPSGEQTAFWRPDTENAAPILRFDDGMVV